MQCRAIITGFFRLWKQGNSFNQHVRQQGKKYADGVGKKNARRREEMEKKKEEFVLKLFSSLRHRFPLSRSLSVLLFQPARRTAGSRHFPTKSSREDFLLIDVETPER